MLVAYGTFRAGRTDEVPSMFHVATRWGHLWFVPLVPLETQLVIERRFNPDGSLQGIRIPFSFKSALLTWLRAVAILACGVAGAFTRDSFRSGGGWTTVGITLTSLMACLWLCRGKTWCLASYERALELGARVGLDAEDRIRLDVMYGRLSATEAFARMEQARFEREEESEEKRPAAAPRDPRCAQCGGPLSLDVNEWTVAGFCSTRCMHAV